MATELKLPEVGDNVEQGTVVTVLVNVGDAVTAGQPIIEIETDKAVVEVPAESAGTVAAIAVKVGDSVKVGGTILTLESGGPTALTAPAPAAPATPAASAPAPAPATPAPTPATPAPAQAASAPGAGQTVTLPEVGDNVEQGTVVTVLVNVGDTVSEGQAVIEIETDKAVVEVPSSAAGTVASIAVKVGDSVKVGGAILTLGGGEAAPATAAAPTQPAPTQPAPAAPELPPQPQGEAAQERLAGGERPSGEYPEASGTYNPQTYQSPAPAPAGAPAQTFDGRLVIPAAPSVRRLAREIGVDLTQVHGSGPAGRISEADLRAAQTEGNQGAAAQPAAPVAQPAAPAAAQPAPATPALVTPAPAPSAAPAAPLPNFEKWGEVRREDMNGIRKATIRSMTASWTTIPMVTHFDKADVTRMEEARKQFAARVEKNGGKLTMTAILIKVVAGALRKFPKFGASLDLGSEQVIYKDYVNLGVAVDTPNGLLVPVIKNADRMGITELSISIGELAAKARDRKLKPDEMQGATFSISNLGGIGGYGFTPIVNAPEVAILGVSRGGMEPVWNKDLGSFEPRNLLPLCVTYDHRLIDGADAARFLRYICETLEDPFLISL